MYIREIEMRTGPLPEEVLRRMRSPGSHFNQHASSVTTLYMWLIRRKVRTPDTSCVRIMCEASISDEQRDASVVLGFGIASFSWPFDFLQYVELQPDCKKRVLLDTLQEALLWIARRQGWPTEPFEEAYREALRRDITLEGMTRKSWLSPDGKYRVRVWYKYELEAVQLWAVLFRNRGRKELCRKVLGTGIPEHGCLWDYLSEGSWISPQVFELRDQSWFRKVWRADFSDVIGASKEEKE